MKKNMGQKKQKMQHTKEKLRNPVKNPGKIKKYCKNRWGYLKIEISSQRNRAAEQGSRAGVTVLAPDFEKFVTERNRRQLLKCKRTINLSTFNVRTLQSIKLISEIIVIAVTYHIDVITAQEHRFYHEDIDLKYHWWTCISASALKNTGNSTIGGVGMLLSPHATKVHMFTC